MLLWRMQATEALREACARDLAAVNGRVHAPANGQTVDVSPGSSSFQLVRGPQHAAENRVAQGCCTVQGQESGQVLGSKFWCSACVPVLAGWGDLQGRERED